MFSAKEAFNTASAAGANRFNNISEDIKAAATLGKFECIISVQYGAGDLRNALVNEGFKVTPFKAKDSRYGTDYVATVCWG